MTRVGKALTLVGLPDVFRRGAWAAVAAALAWAVPAAVAGDDDAYGQAVAAVKALGGEVLFNRALGEGTIEVTFTDVKPRGDVAAALKKLDRPVALGFTKTNITDAELTALLQGLPELKGLTLVMEPKITDAGLAALKGLKGLQSLYLAGTRATDAGLANLEGLTGLRNLGVVAGAEITDGGIGHIEGLTNLQSLDLRATRVGDAGVARLERLAGLRGLDLDGTRVTDAGVVHLIGLKNLRRLSVKTTKVTDDRVASLLVARPQLRVVR